MLYRKEILVHAYSDNIGPMTFSTIGHLNELYAESLYPITIRSSMIDENFDLKPELYDFNITIPVDPDTIKNINYSQLHYSSEKRSL